MVVARRVTRGIFINKKKGLPILAGFIFVRHHDQMNIMDFKFNTLRMVKILPVVFPDLFDASYLSDCFNKFFL